MIIANIRIFQRQKILSLGNDPKCQCDFRGRNQEQCVAKEAPIASMKWWRKTTKKSEISFPVKPYLLRQ